ncbi:hypothetical protein HMPREF9209_1312 [Lactobacillus gasseri 224-1]|uniref:Uncharacterized protein n=1 Tax=Lactobacillus gasseri 224-1 TaxID=679196 RepID=D1YGB5_LACGS|nr:hypothetical protein HMPREF9209_1312 [Lactobacillus gasseri 224-1]
MGIVYLWFVIRSELGIAICLLIWNLAFFLIFLMKSKNSLN